VVLVLYTLVQLVEQEQQLVEMLKPILDLVEVELTVEMALEQVMAVVEF
jgi:hypothetical protein